MTLDWLRQFFASIIKLLTEIVANQLTSNRINHRIEINTSNTNLQLARLVQLLAPPPPVRLDVRLTSDNPTGPEATSDPDSDRIQLGDTPTIMTTKASANFKATVDFQLHDDGTTTATLTPIDSKDEATVLPAGATAPVWASSDPAVTVNSSADGLSAAVAPNITPGQVLPVGVVLTVTCDLGDGTSITGTSDPIDVVPGKATGFALALK